MKKFISFIVLIIVTKISLAQVPQAINYQAVARNAQGQALANQNSKVRLSIIRGATTLYSETRSVTTNALGLFNVQIGSAGASNITGDFNSIYWLNNTPAITLKVELDISNSGVFTDMGSQTLATVPFAYAAANSIETVNLAGRYLDPVVVPKNGDALIWDGSANAWKPAAIPVTNTSPQIKSVFSFLGTVGPSGTNWVFYGTINTITVQAGNWITANFSAALGSSSTTNVSICACYQNTNGGVITPFYPTAYMETPVETGRRIYGFSGAVQTGAGTFKVGFCIRNNTSTTLNNNDYLNGYVQVQ